jgi:diguanylate cyclase (GGDEF)-like protein
MRAAMTAAPSWLCPTPSHRERFLDMQERLRFARVTTIVVGLAIMGALIPKGGWPLAVTCVAMIVVVLIGGARLDRRRRPELWVFYSTVLNIQLALAAGVLMTGGPRTPLSCMLAVPVLMVGARFSHRGLVVGAPISAVLVVGVTLGADPAYVLDNPEALLIPLGLVIASAAYTSPLMASDVRHRADSTLDQLTGLLNRCALEQRFAEITEQAALTGDSVSVVMADIDRFKRINDEHGHSVGDAVLRDVAYSLRRELRTFELLYRLGGEEFLLLLPGADGAMAEQIAENLRSAIADLRPAGIDLTCSFGVASATGRDVAFASLMAQCDTALYAAKRLGRNRVERSGDADSLPQFSTK